MKPVTKYEPRVLDNPGDPINSEWALAVLRYDEVSGDFDTFGDAVKAGREYCEFHGIPERYLVVVLLTIRAFITPEKA